MPVSIWVISQLHREMQPHQGVPCLVLITNISSGTSTARGEISKKIQRMRHQWHHKWDNPSSGQENQQDFCQLVRPLLIFHPHGDGGQWVLSFPRQKITKGCLSSPISALCIVYLFMGHFDTSCHWAPSQLRSRKWILILGKLRQTENEGYFFLC